MLEKLDRTKTVIYYNQLLRGKLVKYYNSDNRYFIHGVMPSLSDKTESLDQSIIVMTNIYDPDARMKYMRLIDFYSPVMVANEERLKFILDEKEVKAPKVFQPLPVQLIQKYNEEKLAEEGTTEDAPKSIKISQITKRDN